jgi:hypothetical protein
MSTQPSVRVKIRDRRNMIFFDCHTGEYPPYECFKQWDPAQIVDLSVRAGADAIAFFSKDHFGNCFCDLPGGHRHKDVKGDYTGQVVAEARRRGLGACVYYSVYADGFAGNAHPDWQVQNPDYEQTLKDGFPWRTLCHNSPFTDEVFIPHVTTIVKRYQPDALFLDTMNFGGVCTCAACKKLWKQMHGSELDTEYLRANPREWITFFHKTWNQAMKRANDACRKIDPQIGFFYGRHDNPDLADEVEPQCRSDFFETSITYNNTELGFLAPGMLARAARTRSGIDGSWVNTFNGCWGEATLKNALVPIAECAGLRANGIWFGLAEYLRSWGKLEPAALDVVGQVFKAEAPFADISVNAKAPRHIAVLDDNGLQGNPCTCGAAKALIETHQQFDIIDETILDKLDGYKVLWAPPIDLWKPERWAKVLAWVKAGGTLMLEAGDYWTKDAGLAPILQAAGVSDVQASRFTAAYLLPENEQADERFGTMSIMVHEPIWRFAAPGARRVVDICDPIDQWDPLKGVVFRMNVLHANTDTRRAGIVQAPVGQGSVILVPGAMSRCYWQHNYSPLRRLIARLIAGAAPVPFTIDAPPYVEANLLTKGGSTILHMVQYCLNHTGGGDPHNAKTNPNGLWCGDRYHDIEDVRPLFDIPVRIRCDAPPKAVILHAAKTELKWTMKDDYCCVVVPRLDLHAAVEVRSS